MSAGDNRERPCAGTPPTHRRSAPEAQEKRESRPCWRTERGLTAVPKIYASLAIAMMTLSSSVHAQVNSADSEIRAIVAAQATAWNAGDGTAYAKDVGSDASFTNLFGMVMYGTAAFAERHRQILATFYRGTTKHHDIRRLRFVTPDVAIVDIDNEVRGVKAMPAGIAVPPDGIVRTQLMEVFVRHGDRWWIEAYHNVDTKPAK